ncbi:mitochondrial carrier [Suhomyces tanzawaensis NRRL Y-17324]|uniref:Mitochondrial thiamine pyrophosphate carrier 1 n=1 Tax=Suhomyces tanzawaensis NRRL Y-17324 TaxID=984487 RepID=A0A1E4SIG1_9ASCO|nr:mitochondrial carrier [Suhomyces tanzawaensis NRRL Y-17324]ODV79291.1 mitochondrial carrier [Suhomyces tanzawaensis NRRL Y-17324]
MSLAPPNTGKSAAEQLSTAGSILAGAIAACGAVTFTNPIDLIKTRMQLQGELIKLAKDAPVLYRNPFQAFGLIVRTEGIRGIQQGLISGYLYQIGLNGCRVGFYERSRYYLTKVLHPGSLGEDDKVPQKLHINVLAGMVSGAIGSVVANPLFLIKTRMQSYTKAHLDTLVGQQTFYRGVWDGLSTVYRAEGFKGLYRGVDAAIMRTGAGSSVQLPTYYLTKNYLVAHSVFAPTSIWLHLVSSSVAGAAVAVVMNPWDVILTRVYNQKGNLYSGPVDCFRKTVRNEGFGALYKGFWAQFFRIGPHSVLMLMFMEQSMEFVWKVEQRFR